MIRFREDDVNDIIKRASNGLSELKTQIVDLKSIQQTLSNDISSLSVQCVTFLPNSLKEPANDNSSQQGHKPKLTVTPLSIVIKEKTNVKNNLNGSCNFRDPLFDLRHKTAFVSATSKNEKENQTNEGSQTQDAIKNVSSEGLSFKSIEGSESKVIEHNTVKTVSEIITQNPKPPTKSNSEIDKGKNVKPNETIEKKAKDKTPISKFPRQETPQERPKLLRVSKRLSVSETSKSPKKIPRFVHPLDKSVKANASSESANTGKEELNTEANTDRKTKRRIVKKSDEIKKIMKEVKEKLNECRVWSTNMSCVSKALF